MLKTGFISLLALTAATPALAQSNPDGDRSDSDIVVTASGVEQKRTETGHTISVITRDDLETSQVISISDALNLVPGVAVAQSGPVGGQTSVFIRGAESSQTLVLIDGVRINDPSTPNGAFDFGALLTGNVERVEVLRGANSVIWGSQAIGGVIDVQTIAPTDTLSVKASAEYGSHDSAKAYGNVSGKSGIVAGSFGAGYYRTEGISSLIGGTERDGYRNFSANGKLLVEFSAALALDLRGYYNKGRIEYDDAFAFPGNPANSIPESENEQFVGYVGLNHDLFDGKWKGRLSYSRTDLVREGSEAGAAGPFNFNVFTARGQVDRFAYDGDLDFGIASLVFGAAHENTFASTFFPLGGDVTPTTFKSDYSSFYGQIGVHPFDGLTVNGGLRYEDHSQYGNHTSFGADAAYTPNDGRTLFRASYAEGFRAPTLSEALPPFGNINLKPETSKGFDVGIEHSFIDRKVTATATYYHRKSNNLIAYNPATFQSENIGRATSKGVEIGLIIRPSDDLDVRVNYALVDATTRSPGANFGNQLARRPRDKASFVADWRSPLGLKLGATIALTGDSFDNINNGFANRLDGYWLTTVRAAFPITDRFEVYGRVENLFDEDYTIVKGYNTYGRAAYGGVRVTF
jgi:vitamin B12 transporter